MFSLSFVLFCFPFEAYIGDPVFKTGFRSPTHLDRHHISTTYSYLEKMSQVS